MKEFQSYVLTENDTKSELTICANPLLVIMAPRAFKYMGYFEDKDIEAMHHCFVSNMVNKFAGKPHELGAAFARQAELAIQLILLRTTMILPRTTTMTKTIMAMTFSMQCPYKKQRTNSNWET